MTPWLSCPNPNHGAWMCGREADSNNELINVRFEVPRPVTMNVTGLTVSFVGRYSVFGTAIRYGLEGPGIELPWGAKLSHQRRPALGLTQPPVQGLPSLSRG